MMENQFPPLGIKKMAGLNASKYYNFQRCKLNVILYENSFTKLIPIPPAAYLGRVIHKLFELAFIGVIQNDDDLNQEWESLITYYEERMGGKKLEKHLVPLELNTWHFEVKKIMAFKTVKNILEHRKTGNNNKNTHFESEKRIETNDGKIIGIIDSIRRRGDHIEIIDFKTGSIIEENDKNHNIKEEHKVQLKLYAAMYFSSFDIWPDELILRGIDRQNYKIPFNPEECLDILDRARNEFDETNILIEQGQPPEKFANPSIDSCKFCVYRPVCKEYWNKRENGAGWPEDIKGTLKDKKKLENGYYKIILSVNDREVSIRDLSQRHSFLNRDFCKVLFCNLRQDKLINNYRETSLTTGYVLNPSDS